VDWRKLKWEVLDLTGYIFCEASIWWWDIFDDGSDIENRIYYPAPWEQLTYLLGVPSYKIGCFFYNLQDDSVWGDE
jgi:hypothetical protein